MKKIRAGISGAGGLVGEGLIRALLACPETFAITYLGSHHAAGRKVADEFKSLAGYTDLAFDPLDAGLARSRCEVVFLAHKADESMRIASELVPLGVRVIDLGGEFRLRDASVYEKWYGNKHTATELLKEAVYGLPELFRSEIKKARLVANPGCYPTGMLLLAAPLAKEGLVGDSLEVASFSGLSGAGRQYQQKNSNLFIDCNENLRAYSPLSHRHQPEMEDALERFTGNKIRVSFVPHLLPLERGISTVIWLRDLPAGMDSSGLLALYREFYAHEPFVRVRENAAEVDLKNVLATNFCDIGAAGRNGVAYLVSAIDNTTKGAVTQAMQNLNLLFGLPETSGLMTPFV